MSATINSVFPLGGDAEIVISWMGQPVVNIQVPPKVNENRGEYVSRVQSEMLDWKARLSAEGQDLEVIP